MRAVARRPFAVALALYLLLTALLVALGLARTGGHWAYALDDPYIHLALARTLAASGDWGLTPGHFDGVSSSPLWVLLLALGRPAPGWGTLLPFALNVLAAVLLLALVNRFLARRACSDERRAAALAAIVLLAPLPSLTLAGMEHLLHAAIALLWLESALSLLAAGGALRPGLLGLSALLTAARPEGLFLIAPASLLLLRRRSWRAALLLAAAGLAPLALYAGFSLRAGGLWLPDPLLVKGRGMDLGSPLAWLSSLGLPLWRQLRQPLSPFSLHLILLIAAGTLLWRRRRALGLDAEQCAALALLLPALLLQYALGGVGWFFRYESWLVILALAVAATLPGLWPPWPLWPRLRLLPVTALLLAAALGLRGAVALNRVPLAMANIHGQQLQMARYLAERHAGETVVVDDVGAVSYFARVRCVDPLGLADPLFARARREGRLERCAARRRGRAARRARGHSPPGALRGRDSGLLAAPARVDDSAQRGLLAAAGGGLRLCAGGQRWLRRGAVRLRAGAARRHRPRGTGRALARGVAALHAGARRCHSRLSAGVAAAADLPQRQSTRRAADGHFPCSNRRSGQAPGCQDLFDGPCRR